MNACAACREQIELRMDGMLEAPLAAQLESHLSKCAACRQYESAQRALSDDLAGLTRVADAMAVSRHRETRRASRWMHAGKVAAALALAVLCTWTFVRKPSNKPGVEPSPVAKEETHVDSEPRPLVRFAVSVEPLDGERRFAVPIKTENPRVHMVWLYDNALPMADPAPASAPSS